MPTRTVTPALDRGAASALVLAPDDVTTGRASAFPLRREGPGKLTGTAKYTDDLVFPGMLYGRTVRSSRASGSHGSASRSARAG